MRIEDLPEGLIERVVQKLRSVEPAIGVLAHGSYARGLATPQSDLDLTVLIEGSGLAHYRSWFETLPNDTLLYVSANTDLTVDQWSTRQREPEDWSYGFPATVEFRWLWAVSDEVRSLLGEPPVQHHPAAPPEVEDLVETTSKIIRANADLDDDGVRMWAHVLIGYAASTVVAINEVNEVHNPRGALDALLLLSNVPNGWRDDVRVCLGLDPTDASGVAETARQLTMRVLALLREKAPDVDQHPGVTESLSAGTYERWLASM
jgi:phosphoribosyl-AMP cyclohydrolase